MKYMGSKRFLLQNGLGDLILEESRRVKRIVDLFCGAGSVVRFAAENINLPVQAYDLQQYSIVLAKSILVKTSPIDSGQLEKKWIIEAERKLKRSLYWNAINKLSIKIDMRSVRRYVEHCRELCHERSIIGPIWNAYGGHYFSPEQALTFDYLLNNLPLDTIERTNCQAAMIIAAMRCIASPGHTAQPLQPTRTAGRFIIQAWSRNVIDACKKALKEVCGYYARIPGDAFIGEASEEAKKLKSTDLVFVDPPYTGVHYSRFYHVLETIANNSCGPVSGVGRYPPITERPQSEFSNVSQSQKALDRLLKNLSKVGSTVIFTYPEGECSNGLSGDAVLKKAQEYFSHIEKKVIPGIFSTLGGNKKKRDSRKDSRELVLLMRRQ